MATTAALAPMKITGYLDKEYTKPFKGKPYSVMINPDSLKWAASIDYNEQQAADTSSASQKYQSSPGDKLSFDIVIDCTGVVDKTRTNMLYEIGKLRSIVYKYNGKIHRPNYVKIQWGKNIKFSGVLNTIDVSYTLFKPDGTPLRAKVALAFSRYLSPVTVTKKDAPKSPDLTHVMDVTEGISLPQMCASIWNDETHYIQVARYNDLNKFRNLKGIQRIIFPPIIQPV